MIDLDTTIKIDKLSKRYRIGLKNEMHDSLMSALVSFIKSPIENYKKYRALYRFDDIVDSDKRNDANNGQNNVIWALKDISLQVKKGEVIGIIGRNGAGKTTLLKIISKITTPTYGRAEIRGRISSLLEVGTGFHPELTGRDNVYLNGTILGMTKKEVDHKFDEIVEFSGIHKFIDTPVKRYSVGMKVRLGFSVAAHLEPEILVVDEVLAVGDYDFQKKCLNKMEDAGQHGRTVIFVSHSMPAITRLCARAILLEEGRIIDDGAAGEVVSNYITSGSGITAERVWHNQNEAPGGEVVKLRAVRIHDQSNNILNSYDIRKPIGIEMEYDVIKDNCILLPHHMLYNEEGGLVFTTIDTDPNWRRRPRSIGKYISTVWIPGNLLSEGMLYVTSALFVLKPRRLQFYEHDVVSFQVVDSSEGDTARGDWGGPVKGVVRPLLQWENKYHKFH
jgi:lipopolysaccharide transport system ATP-binding protein